MSSQHDNAAKPHASSITGFYDFSEEHFRIVVQNAKDAIITVNMEGKIVFWNAATEKMFGYSRDEVLNRQLDFIIPEEFREKHRGGIERMLRTGQGKLLGKTVEVFGIKKDGSEFPLELSLAAGERAGEMFFTAIIRDITTRKENEKKLEQYAADLEAKNRELNKAMEKIRELSLYDDLTGLYNRRGFLTLAEQQMRNADRNGNVLTIWYIDMDNLKKINDAEGHTEGDKAIKTLTQALVMAFRKSDIISRIGGDEFVVMSINAPGESSQIKERLKQKLGADGNPERFYQGDISVSIGCSYYYPTRPETIGDLLGKADKKMYAEKRRKRGG
jgi:diguanylate cyclase (GGDEF)-like protein/PAS domain S-box-containing protein